MLKGVNVTLLMGPVVPVPVPQAVLDALTSIQVTTSAAPRTPSGFQLTFQLSQKSPLHTLFLLSGGSLVPFMRVIIIVTMNGTPDVLMDGVITRQDVQGGENGQSTLTLTGTDLTTLMNLIDGDGTPFPAMPHNIRVMLILQRLRGSARRAAEIVAHAVGVFLTGFLAVYAVKFVYVSWKFEEISEGSDAMPLWIPRLAMAVGAVALFVAMAHSFVEILRGAEIVDHDDAARTE